MRRTFIQSLVITIAALTMAVPAASATTPPPPPLPPGSIPANTPHVPYCETVEAATWCVVLSTTYPKTVGNYGWIGMGQRCGPTPLPGWFGSLPPSVGICSMPAPQPIWKWSNTGWSASSLEVGTQVYVYPSSWSNWRWIWTPTTDWALIPANKLLLKWKPS